MTVYDVRFRDLAEKLIDNTFGTVATLRRHTSAYDVASGKVTNTTTEEHVKISPPQPYNESRLSGVVQTGQLLTYLAAKTSSRPAVDDEVIFDGKTFTVLNAQLVVSGDQMAAYKVTLVS
ncbi:MAG: hypothetical protein NXH95_02530 [Pseudomonadaceae bacterium]|nr:hypothetical protein [Pseudomonadaceae bacterium]